MIRNVYFWADTHVGHKNAYNFVDKDNNPMRPYETF
jgi:calcineurin-like phosphoesterase family protein